MKTRELIFILIAFGVAIYYTEEANQAKRVEKQMPKNFKYFNSLGQPVDEYYTGVIFRRYEDGTTERIYR